ncbi:hypothetical protein EX895_001108 [Sporisorium graminicola]|uniref:U2-associated protein SR140 n=1 Tax=Sporisorium graminicola TaxID=280036 RepID=A0A4U7KY95_9BASI|nr:hypothetical protein EX895_001108 [Sporisorium graminicola]TKY89811.1 hypothetical protein EX895_001108 [Sporisorium graminicola]
MSSSGGSGYGQRPSRLARVNLGADDDVDELDYSEQAGPSNPSRHMAISSRAYPSTSRSDPRSTHRSPSYHDLDRSSSYTTASRLDPDARRSAHHSRPSPSRPPPHPRSRTPSPQPDKDVLDYIRAQKEQSSSTSKHELALAEQLKKERFEHGAGKVKSRVQKEREAEERKRKQAQEDAAKAYEEFVAAMGGESEQAVSENRERQERKPMGFVAAGGKAYVASRSAQPASAALDTSPSQAASASKESLKRVNSAFGDDSSGDEAPSSTGKEPPPARKRHQAMSSFLTELQTEQAERESRLSNLASSTNTSISTLLAHETLAKPGSRDLASDPLTTNICILSLPPHIDERSMGEFFRAWGDVATVKIMWPRGEQRERVVGLTGFVSYMTRSEAEYAFKQADGVMWGGIRVKLSWGKAMPLPARAMYPMSRDRQVDKQADDGRQASDRLGGSGGSSAVPKLIIRHRKDGTSTDDKKQHIRSRVHDDYPQTQRLFIETVASRIRSNGPHFEHVLREREADNPKFSFLFEPESVLHHYFRMCLDPHYLPTLLHLDAETDFNDAGSDELYSTDSGEESETQYIARSTPSTGGASAAVPLGGLARRRLCSMLRGLTLRRERIARITAFALDHAASYASIVQLLTTSLLQPATPVPRKLARLYALSDILHNSGTPISNAWRYRAALEAQLPLVFAHLGQVAASFAGRMKREEFKGRVGAVLDVWEGWIVVSPHVLERLRRLLECPPAAAVRGKVHVEEDVDGEVLNPISAQSVQEVAPSTKDNEEEEEDLDGEAL